MPLVLLLLVAVAPWARAQELQATRFELKGPAWDGSNGAIIGSRETVPLVIGTTAPVAQPIRFLVGPFGSDRVVELTGGGETWIKGPLAIGATTGTLPNVQVHLSDVAPENGVGMCVDLRGTSSVSGIQIRNIGLTGEAAAGVILSAQANGFGTGIRFGGPVGSERGTLLTAIDITGGTGLRYNALRAGEGTALEIGGTVAPQRGVDVEVSGSGHVGIVSRANTLGSGVIGMSASGAYDDIAVATNTGVLGWAASNANTRADTVTGVRAVSQRGGQGSRAMMTIGLRAEARSDAQQHAGNALGLLAQASATAPGVAVAIGAAFRAPREGFAVASLGGDTFLGSSFDEVPEDLEALTSATETQTLTHAFAIRTSGGRYHVGVKTIDLPQGGAGMVDPGPGEILRVQTDAAGSTVDGLEGAEEGRTVIVINLGGPLTLHNNAAQALPGLGFLLPDGLDVVIPPEGAVQLWFDAISEGWRLVGASW